MAIKRTTNVTLGYHLNSNGIRCERILTVSTFKPLRGGITSTASVASKEPGSLFLTHAVYQDYMDRLALTSDRATQKNIDRIHEDSLAMLDQITQCARAAYTDWLAE